MANGYTDPTTDPGFRQLFGHAESKEVLKGFVSDILELPQPVQEISFIPDEQMQLPDWPVEREGIYDMHCTDTDGNRFIVELQRNPSPSFKEHALFYAMFTIIQQIEKGTFYDFSLLPVYCISVLCSASSDDDNDSDYIQRVRLADVEGGKVFYEGLTFVFVELSKFSLTLDQVTTSIEKWLYLLKHMPELDDIPPPLNGAPFSLAFNRMEQGSSPGE